MRSWLTAALALAVAIYAALVAARNSDLLRVNLVFFTVEQVPAWMALLGALLLGVASTALAFAWPLVRLRLRLRRQSRQLTRLEQEVHGLRTLPLSEDAARATSSARER